MFLGLCGVVKKIFGTKSENRDPVTIFTLCTFKIFKVVQTGAHQKFSKMMMCSEIYPNVQIDFNKIIFCIIYGIIRSFPLKQGNRTCMVVDERSFMRKIQNR